jgi:hypothetical protein
MDERYGECCYYEESESIEAAFRKLIHRFCQGDHSYFEESIPLDEKYSAEYQASRLDALFESLIAANKNKP